MSPALKQAIWDLYRTSPLHNGAVTYAGLAGPDDLEAALESTFEWHHGDGTDEDPPIRLCDSLWADLSHFEWELRKADRLPFIEDDPNSWSRQQLLDEVLRLHANEVSRG